jgi:hypothetical protein
MASLYPFKRGPGAIPGEAVGVGNQPAPKPDDGGSAASA